MQLISYLNYLLLLLFCVKFYILFIWSEFFFKLQCNFWLHSLTTVIKLLILYFRNNFPDWQSGYEKLTDMIVPRSSQLITQDSDYGLFTVTLFKKVVEEFKLHAREKKSECFVFICIIRLRFAFVGKFSWYFLYCYRFVVREFTYNEEELAAGKNEITKLVLDKKKQFVSIWKNRISLNNLFEKKKF